MTKNWLSFKTQEDGSYLFDEDGVSILISKDGLFQFNKNGDLIFEKQFGSPTKAMLKTAEIYEKFK